MESTFEVLVRDAQALDRALLDEEGLAAWIGRLLGLSAIGVGVHGLAVGVVVQLAGRPGHPLSAWLGPWPVLVLPLALVAALTLTLAVCLPSFWFYTQLSGIDVSFRFVTAQALRVQARTAVLLLGTLPFYVALALGRLVGLVPDDATVILAGLALPFVVGLAGIGTLYASFRRLLPELPTTGARRGRFLARMVLAWGAVYTAVAPVALYHLGGVLRGMV